MAISGIYYFNEPNMYYNQPRLKNRLNKMNINILPKKLTTQIIGIQSTTNKSVVLTVVTKEVLVTDYRKLSIIAGWTIIAIAFSYLYFS